MDLSCTSFQRVKVTLCCFSLCLVPIESSTCDCEHDSVLCMTDLFQSLLLSFDADSKMDAAGDTMKKIKIVSELLHSFLSC